jgi:hypothetical protein
LLQAKHEHSLDGAFAGVDAAEDECPEGLGALDALQQRQELLGLAIQAEGTDASPLGVGSTRAPSGWKFTNNMSHLLPPSWRVRAEGARELGA